MVSTTARQAIGAAVGQLDSGDRARLGQDLRRFAFDDGQVRRSGDEGLHGAPVELAVGLGARSLDGRTLAAVEDAELDAGQIGGAAHDPVQGVDLPHQMALAQAADRRIAGHFADCREPVGDERGPGARARRRGRGLAARVPAPDHNDVKSHGRSASLFHVKHRPICLSASS